MGSQRTVDMAYSYVPGRSGDATMCMQIRNVELSDPQHAAENPSPRPGE